MSQAPSGRRLRVVTVEDEPLGQERFRQVLAGEPGVDLVGQAMTGAEAVALIRELRPDLVFLDIHLPGCTGFSVLEELGDALPKAVVFVTAHDDFALRAFEIHAVDYVLKPLDKARIHEAVVRARERIGNPGVEELTRQLHDLLSQRAAQDQSKTERIPIKADGRILLLNVRDIDWIGSADNYVEIHVGAQVHLLNQTMTAMEQRLAGGVFVRISRTCIVNRHRVQELRSLQHGQYAVLLRDGTRLILSRSHRRQLPLLGIS